MKNYLMPFAISALLFFAISCDDENLEDIMEPAAAEDLSQPKKENSLFDLIGTTDVDTIYFSEGTSASRIAANTKKVGIYSAGKPDNLDDYRSAQDHYIPSGFNEYDIVAKAIDGENNYVFTWYRTGKVTATSASGYTNYMLIYDYKIKMMHVTIGSNTYLTDSPTNWSPGEVHLSSDNIVDIAIDGGNNKVFTYYLVHNKLYVMQGKTADLGASESFSKVKAVSGSTHNITGNYILGIGIDGSSDRVYSWTYIKSTGRIECKYGSTQNFKYLYDDNCTLQTGKSANQVRNIGFDGYGNDRAYVYYKQ